MTGAGGPPPSQPDTDRHRRHPARWPEVTRRAAQTSMDSNTVDMDRERASFVDNSVKYEATLRFINTDVRTMLDAMKSPSQG